MLFGKRLKSEFDAAATVEEEEITLPRFNARIDDLQPRQYINRIFARCRRTIGLSLRNRSSPLFLYMLTSPSDSHSRLTDEPPTLVNSMAADHTSRVNGFMRYAGINDELPARYSAPDSYSDLVFSSLRSDRVERGRVTCTLTAESSLLNEFGGLHGGVVAAVAERVSIACARTVVNGDRDLFLGELGISYLSSAPQNAKLTVDGSIVKSGRNVTTVVVDFKLEDSGKLMYTTRATLYTTPTAKL